jgi:hypothetical protein
MNMRIHSWCLTLGIVGVSAVAVVACTSTTTVNNGPGEDASTVPDDSSTTTEPDTGTTADTGTTVPTPDGATTVTEAGDGGGTCVVALDTGSADCDSCTAACCTQLTTCATPDDAGVDDAGSSACLQLLGCINDINASSDAGVDAGVGETTCDPSYTTDQQANAEAVLTCIRTNCATQCPGL